MWKPLNLRICRGYFEMPNVAAWILTEMANMQVSLGGMVLLLNSFLIHVLYDSSTTLPVYMLLHLYNTITPILMILYGRRCCTLAGSIGIIYKRYKSAASPATFRSILWLIVTGVLCGCLILTGRMGNTYESSYRLVGDFRSIPTYLQNTMHGALKPCSPLQEDETTWTTAVKMLLYIAYRMSASWLMVLPIVLIALMRKKMNDGFRGIDDVTASGDCEQGNLTSIDVPTKRLRGVLRGIATLMFRGVLSVLLFWLPFDISFPLHIIFLLVMMGMAVLDFFKTSKVKKLTNCGQPYRDVPLEK